VVNVIGSADAEHLVLITNDRVVVLAVEDLSPDRIIETADFGGIVAATMDPDTLVLAYKEEGVRLVEISTGAELHRFDVINLFQLELSLDGALLAGASVDGELYIWDVESGEMMHEMILDGMVSNLTFAPDGMTLAVEVEGGPFVGIEMWSVESGERMRRLEWTDRAGPLYFVRLSPDWTTAVWVSRTTVMLMDIESGEAKAVLPHEDFVGEAEFSPDSDVVVTTSAAEVDGALAGVANLWDSGSGSKTSTLVHGEAPVRTTFSPDGSVLATTTFDGVIRLWDVASAEMIAELDGDQEQVFRLFFAWGGRLLVSASWDGPVRFWAVQE
jgi:WD40 repeat protein